MSCWSPSHTSVMAAIVEVEPLITLAAPPTTRTRAVIASPVPVAEILPKMPPGPGMTTYARESSVVTAGPRKRLCSGSFSESD